MSNIGTTRRFNGVKPPVIRSINKNSIYNRSPSMSRLAISDQPMNNNSPTKIISNQTFNWSRNTRSCQNLSDLHNKMAHPSSVSDRNYVPNPTYYGTTINRSSTTNNSFGNQDYPQSTIRSNVNTTFYDWSSPTYTSKTNPNKKSISLDSSSTNSSDATTGTTLSSPVHNLAQRSTIYNSVNKTYKTDNGYNSRDGSLSSINSSLRSDTIKSFNNNGNEHLGLIGLANLGNTCFMNSVLQCLSNCRTLHGYCLSHQFEPDLNGNSKTRGALIKSYCEMMKAMWRPDAENYISPDKFRRAFQKIAPSFNSSSQQDSQEFLRIMLEGLHQDVNRVQQRPKPLKINEQEDEKLPERELASVYWNRYIRVDDSFIVDLFVGQLKSTLRCRTCGYKSVTYDPFWDLSLPLPKNHRGNTTLSECLDLFTSEEVLDDDEMPCAKCKQKRPCSKRFSIQKFPPVLVIHLKRFSGDRYRSKISTFIEFSSTTLDLSPYVADTCIQHSVTYSLFGISNHSGTVYGGHYTAYCCHPYSHLWYEFNDTMVHRVDDTRICSSEAYVLFYEIIR